VQCLGNAYSASDQEEVRGLEGVDVVRVHCEEHQSFPGVHEEEELVVFVQVTHPGPELQSDQREKGEIFHQFTVQWEHFIRLAMDGQEEL